jgi:hypothetical protein
VLRFLTGTATAVQAKIAKGRSAENFILSGWYAGKFEYQFYSQSSKGVINIVSVLTGTEKWTGVDKPRCQRQGYCD